MATPLVSIIIPVKDAEPYIDECMASILAQTYPAAATEVSLYDDGSADGTRARLREWVPRLRTRGCRVVYLERADCDGPRFVRTGDDAASKRRRSGGGAVVDSGVAVGGAAGAGAGADAGAAADVDADTDAGGADAGAAARTPFGGREACLAAYRKIPGVRYLTGVARARNESIRQSTGEWLCFLDADDVMRPERIALLVRTALADPDAHRTIFGTRFERIPAGSTPRYAAWNNGLTDAQLYTSRFRECTIAMPTWFAAREWFLRLGLFDETDWRPEDLLLFYRHLEAGGKLRKLPDVGVLYRHTPGSVSFKVHRLSLLQVKIEFFERTVAWPRFSIVGFGRDAKAFYNHLSPAGRARVAAFYDVNPKRIGTTYVDSHHGDAARAIPIVGFDQAAAPAVVCVALDRDGRIEADIGALGWVEGIDYFQFS